MAASVVFAMLLCVAIAAPAHAQTAGTLSGTLRNSRTGQPVPQATVQLDELKRQVVTGDDGGFVFENVPPGLLHLSVQSPGFSSRRTEVTVTAAAAPPITVTVDPDLHFAEVVSVSAEARSQFDSFQPTSVLAGQEMAKRVEMSLGATLDQQPGVSSRSLGPAPSRPVVRGLDGDRVLILQDGKRVGDLSSQSGDHGVAVNPAAARRIEVVRGPATLLYGANAIGGLVNVISDDVPRQAVTGVSGSATFDAGTGAREAGAAADLHVGNGAFAMHASGAGRRSGDVRTPDGDIGNSQSRTGMGTIGGSWTGTRGYLGASYGYDDTKYGIPVIEEGTLQLTPRRHSFSVRGEAQRLEGAFDGLRGTLSVRRYAHDELEGEEVGTAFKNDTTELELMASHRAAGRLKGSAGVWLLDRAFDARGEEALAPAVDQSGVAAFIYEELAWPHVTVQFGGRVDHNRFAPFGEPERRFTTGSGSLGLLFRPAAAADRVTIAASLARAARNPALEELFFYGEHHGNFAIELGNPNLKSEHALGFDLSLRWRGSRASGEVTYFRNAIDDFIYRELLTHDDFEAREEEFAARFPGRTLAGHEHGDEGDESDDAGHEDEVIVDFVGADALLQGVEAHADVSILPNLFAEVGLDYVRGSLRADSRSLPRMPPLRGRTGLRYQRNALQTGGEVTLAASQERVGQAEEPTAGYSLVKLFASYSFEAGGATSTLTARVDNLTNERYRNHLSLIKQFVPEMGRSFRVVYAVHF